MMMITKLRISLALLQLINEFPHLIREHLQVRDRKSIIPRALPWLVRHPCAVGFHEAQCHKHMLEIEEIGIFEEEAHSSPRVMPAMFLDEIALAHALLPLHLILRRQWPCKSNHQHLKAIG